LLWESDDDWIVDEIEDAEFPEFNEAQQISTSCPHLFETKHVENTALS
jgi:hypothetical protein